MNVYEYVFQSISGSTMPLRNWTGQPIMLVNTASECGFTPQYGSLQTLHNDYHAGGLILVGIPCNDFGEQEPGTEEEILKFTWDEYRVSFQLTRKTSVLGLGAHPLFHALRDEFGSDISPRWNFEKYLFDRKGQLIEHWPSRVDPLDPLITHQVERHLQSWVL
jgi:glutathione peroxidase